MLLVTIVLVLVFAGPAITWIHRWILSPAIQCYAILIIPAVVYWIWIARRRLAMPEVIIIREVIRLERQTRITPKEIGERDKTVLNVLLEQPPVQDVRSAILLYCVLAFDSFAFWIRWRPFPYVPGIYTDNCWVGAIPPHEGFAFKAAMFPCLFMFAMIPIPGPISDMIVDRAQPAILGTVEHMVNNVSTVAAVPPAGDPLTIKNGSGYYSIYAERAGLCIPQSILVLLCAVFYLSLIRTSNPLPKIGVIASTMAACFVVLLARLIVVAWAAAYDKDIAGFLEVLTRYLLVGVDLALLVLFVKGFKCLKYHRWVSLSLKY